MQLKVERLSKFGFLSNEVWYNPDKRMKPDFSGLKIGMVLDAEVNENFVRSFKIVGEEAVQSKPASKPFSKPSFQSNNDPATQERIGRGNACNAVFGSPAVAGLVKDMDVSEASQTIKNLVEITAKYINTGAWA